jgi:hypothetical protein
MILHNGLLFKISNKYVAITSRATNSMHIHIIIYDVTADELGNIGRPTDILSNYDDNSVADIYVNHRRFSIGMRAPIKLYLWYNSEHNTFRNILDDITRRNGIYIY